MANSTPPAPAVSAVTPLQGTTTVDDKMVFGPQRLSYASADAIAAQITSQVKNEVSGRLVIIANTALLVDFSNLQAVYLNLESLQSDYNAVSSYADAMNQRRAGAVRKPKRAGLEVVEMGPDAEAGAAAVGIAALTAAAVPPLAPVTAAITAAIGLVSLFRQDVVYQGTVTTVDGLAFELALAARVRAAGASRVYVPDLAFMPSVDPGPGSIRNRLANIQASKVKAWGAIGPALAELVCLEAQLDVATREKNQKSVDQLSSEVASLRSDLDPVTAPLNRADQKLSDLQTQWNQTEATSGMTVLARLLRAEAIRELNPRYLHAAIVASGGYNRISHNLFRTLFVGDGLSFTGGTVARWALLEDSGAVTLGGVASAQITWGTLLGLKDRLRQFVTREKPTAVKQPPESHSKD
jgi:hypothetical protein